MQEPGGKRVQDSWSKVGLGVLKRAAALHGREWAAVAATVGSKTRRQRAHKLAKEVAAGRMQEPGGKLVHYSWSKTELLRPKKAVDRHGHSWVAVSLDVGSKRRAQCFNKSQPEVAAGRWRC
jgi:hypothetical protein